MFKKVFLLFFVFTMNVYSMHEAADNNPTITIVLSPGVGPHCHSTRPRPKTISYPIQNNNVTILSLKELLVRNNLLLDVTDPIYKKLPAGEKVSTQCFVKVSDDAVLIDLSEKNIQLSNFLEVIVSD